jgi:hypothetical protein
MPLLVSLSRRLLSIVTLPCAVAFSLLVVGSVQAQSTDVRFPTPVQTNEVVGTIAARDIGDARLTNYFYTFIGVPGDLLITIESKNLNGDLDIFTAGELRPLLKISVYAESTSTVTKNIYFRKRESLILRVEARTPNDNEGIYQIRFSGSFEPMSALADDTESRTVEPSKATSRSSDRKVTRVSSVGARIEEPPAEVAAAPTPTPEEPAETPKPAPSKTTRRGRASARRTPPKPAAPSETANTATGEKSDASKPGTDTEKKEEATKETPAPAAETPKEISKTESKPKPVRGGATRRTPKTKPAAEPEPESGQRLVIEIKDGTRIEFLMNTVRSVTIYGGQIVIVGKDGKVERVSMSNVVRMSIGP